MSGGISDEGVLKKLLQQMNSQMPTRRFWLSELLPSKTPHYVGRDGTRFELDKEELELISKTLAAIGERDVKLPLILYGDSSQTVSAWRAEGPTECALLSQILEKPLGSSRDKIYLFAPHMAVLRRKLPTCTACAFLP